MPSLKAQRPSPANRTRCGYSDHSSGWTVMRYWVIGVATVAFLVMVLSVAAADSVLVDNGDRISGAVTTMQDGVLTVETDCAGSVGIDWARVVRLRLDEELPVVLADGTEVTVWDLPTHEIALAEVTAIAPPPPRPPTRPRWKGRVDFGWATASGNRDTQLGTLAAFGERAYAASDRFSLLLDAAKGSSEGEDTADRARIEGKYDRGASGRSYRYYLAGIGYDRVRDIDRRVEVGSGVGRTLLDRAGHVLTAEVGLSYVRDDLATGDTESDAKLRMGEAWRREMGQVKLRQSLALLSAADELRDYTAEFVLALTHELSDRLSLTAKLSESYDSRPAPDTERRDTTFTTQLGMVFGE